jgi:hypothetical protein
MLLPEVRLANVDMQVSITFYVLREQRTHHPHAEQGTGNYQEMFLASSPFSNDLSGYKKGLVTNLAPTIVIRRTRARARARARVRARRDGPSGRVFGATVAPSRAKPG